MQHVHVAMKGLLYVVLQVITSFNRPLQGHIAATNSKWDHLQYSEDFKVHIVSLDSDIYAVDIKYPREYKEVSNLLDPNAKSCGVCFTLIHTVDSNCRGCGRKVTS